MIVQDIGKTTLIKPFQDIVSSGVKLQSNEIDIKENKVKGENKAELKEFTPKPRKIPKAPPYFLIYKIAPGFSSVEISYEMNYAGQFLNHSI